jgi:hypothetical protein
MERRKLWVVILVVFFVGTLGIGVPSASARPRDGGEPGLLACGEVFAAMAEIWACSLGLREACLLSLLNFGLGLTEERIEVCADFVLIGASKLLCEADGGTWFPGDPPLCIPCGRPGYECYEVTGYGGSGNVEGKRGPYHQIEGDTAGVGGGGGGFLWLTPNGYVSTSACWVLCDEYGNVIASGCN